VSKGGRSRSRRRSAGGSRDVASFATTDVTPSAPAHPRAAELQQLAARPAARGAALVLVLGAFAIQGIVAARTNTPTPDEFVYVPEGYYHLRTGDLAFDPTNPPLLKMAMALPLLAMDVELDTDPRWRDDRTGWGPWTFGTRFMNQNREHYLDAFFAARLVVLAVAVGLGALVFRRARAVLSPAGAIAALVLYGTAAPILAHGSLATLDVGVSALMFASLLALERFAKRQDVWGAGLTGLLLGLAFAVKGVAALFFPLVPILLAISWKSWDRAGLRRLGIGAATMALGAWLAVEAAYGFSDFPLPAPLLDGIRFQAEASSAGEFPAFLNGEWSQTGWWSYYAVALALKTPIPMLVLVAVGLVATARRWRDPELPWIVLPPVFLIYALSFHYGKNYGIRYLLPAFPFLVLLAGRGVDALLELRRGSQIAGALLAWQIAAAVLATPQQLAYFNELAGGPDRARRLLLDSNLDWGQDLGRLKKYLDEHGIDRICLGYFGHVDPHVYGIEYSFPPNVPTPGRCAVSANFLAGYPYGITYAGEGILPVRPDAWVWFDRFEPVARVGSSIYVFDISAADVRAATGS
jgi:hypothetical protein